LLVFEKFTNAYLFQIAREKSCDYLLIVYVQKFQTNSWQCFYFALRGLTLVAYKDPIGPNIYPVVFILWRDFVFDIIF